VEEPEALEVGEGVKVLGERIQRVGGGRRAGSAHGRFGHPRFTWGPEGFANLARRRRTLGQGGSSTWAVLRRTRQAAMRATLRYPCGSLYGGSRRGEAGARHPGSRHAPARVRPL